MVVRGENDDKESQPRNQLGQCVPTPLDPPVGVCSVSLSNLQTGSAPAEVAK